jgi:hypothetical protein
MHRQKAIKIPQKKENKHCNFPTEDLQKRSFCTNLKSFRRRGEHPIVVNLEIAKQSHIRFLLTNDAGARVNLSSRL